MLFIYFHISVTGSTPSSGKPVIFSSKIPDPLRPSFFFFFFKLIITVSIVVFDHANHTRKKRSTMGYDQFSRTDSLLFNLKIEALVLLDLMIQIQPFQSG